MTPVAGPAPAPAPESPARSSQEPGALERWAVIGLGLAIALYAATQLWLTRGTTVFVDEIKMFTEAQGIHLSSLLTPFNEHLELARRLLYAVGFKLFGAGTTFLLARLAQVIGMTTLAGVVFAFLRRRMGARAAVAPTVLLLFLGSAWELNYVISGIGNVYAMAAGIWALVLIDRRDSRADLLASGLLIVSVVSFTTGLAFAVGAVCLLLLAPDGRRRIWVALAPIAVYAAWLAWVHFIYTPVDGEVQQVTLSNLMLIPNMIAQQAGATGGALAGLNYNFVPTGVFGAFSTSSDYGAVIAAAAAGLLCWRLRRPSHPMLWALVAVLVAYWAELSIGFGAGRNPTTVRYVFASGTVAVLLAAEAAGTVIRGRRALLILFGVVTFALLGNAARLRDGMRFFRVFATTARAQLAALEIAGPAVAPGFTTQVAGFTSVTAGPYLAAVGRNGSAAYAPGELAGASPTLRAAADSTLVAAERIGLAVHPRIAGAPGCRRLAPGATATIALGSPGVTLRSASATPVSLARFGDGPGVSVGNLPAGTTVALGIPSDRSARPWRLTITAPAATVTVCTPGQGV